MNRIPSFPTGRVKEKWDPLSPSIKKKKDESENTPGSGSYGAILSSDA